MSELRKSNTDYAYFITLTVVGWVDVFTRKEHCDIILKNLNYCQVNKGLEIYAKSLCQVICLVARHQNGKLNEILRDFKSFTLKAIIKSIEESTFESRKEWLIYLFKYFGKKYKQNKVYMFWQKTNHPIELFSSKVMDQKIEYIENNPVAACIVDSPENFIYSSASKFSPLTVMSA